MNKAPALAAAAALAATSFSAISVPSTASAQEWRGDPCMQERHDAGRTGTIAGGLIGALIGNQVAGHGNRTAGTVIGGAAGAVVGHQIGAHTVKCTRYPTGYRYHAGCRWVEDTYKGRTRSSEICQDRDGYWRRHRD